MPQKPTSDIVGKLVHFGFEIEACARSWLTNLWVHWLTGLCIWDHVYLRKSARCGEDDDTKWVCQPKCLQFSIRPDLRDYLTCYRRIIFSAVFRFSFVNLDRLNRLDSHGHTLMLLVQFILDLYLILWMQNKTWIDFTL